MPELIDELRNLLYPEPSIAAGGEYRSPLPRFLQDEDGVSGSGSSSLFKSLTASPDPISLSGSFKKRVGEMRASGFEGYGGEGLPADAPDPTNPNAEGPLPDMEEGEGEGPLPKAKSVSYERPVESPGRYMSAGVAGQQASADQQDADYMREFADAVREQKNDIFRMALLKAGTAMMGNGTFSEQLARGAQGFQQGMDTGQQRNLSGLKALAEAQMGEKKSQNALSSRMQTAMMSAMQRRQASNQKADASRSKQASDILSNPLFADLSEEQKEALMQVALGGAGVKVPGKNISKAVQPGQEVNGYTFKGGDPNDRNNWEKD